MYVDHARQLIFLAQPRAASRAIGEFMLDRGAMRVQSHHGVDRPFARNLAGEGYTRFSVVRNHWDWLVSFYHLHRERQERRPFAGWLPSFIERDSWIQQPEDRLADPGGYRAFWKFYDDSDVILRHESLAEDFQRLYGEELTVLVGRSRRQPLAYYFDAHGLISLVEQRFADEIARLDYGWPAVAA